ncbi:hypothetical protein VIBNISFn118_660063 [Vibrio nigripulchritudo SFn118]|nr:hypothetical protein VIBNISFn118_660063 [Vibrio nigripulchritudo SFn118]
MAHKYRKLLAYVGWEDGRVTIELVKLSRNGNSYHLQGDRWRRMRSGFLDDDNCTNDSGRTIKISLLSRRRCPNWVDVNDFQISNLAEEQYRSWLG